MRNKRGIGSDSMSRIVIIDDDLEIADLMKLYLQNEGYEVETFYSGEETLERLKGMPPDLLILDIMMPGIDGYQIVEELRKDYFYPVIMVSAKTEDVDVLKGLILGSDDYIKKPFNPMELVQRVKALLRRKEVYYRKEKETENIFCFRGLFIDYEKGKVLVNEEEVSLTTMEYKILKLLSQNLGEVFSAEQILKEVTGEDYYNQAYNSVATHISNLRLKLKDSFEDPIYIKTVWGKGYRIE
ncbi:response regulator transcription factor [Tissierella sp. DSM 105185]|uniref:Response regulator transcription factor n=2 Tax=Tissierella pigra TaxID=2607614 RepID=A0A6N7Y480_9FIRM|nr:response regulator transcription factor [Tissierella pigra]